MKKIAQPHSNKFYFLSEANTLLDGSLADFLIWCRQQGIQIYRIKPKDSEVTRAIVESSALLRFAYEFHMILRYWRLPEVRREQAHLLVPLLRFARESGNALGEMLLPVDERNEFEIPIAPDPQWHVSLIELCQQHKLSCTVGFKVAHYKPLTRIRDRHQIIINGHAIALKRSVTGALFDADPFRMVSLNRDVPEDGYLLVWMEDRQFCFIIPGYLVAGQIGIMLPTLAGIQSRWQRFREAWEFLKQPPEIIK